MRMVKTSYSSVITYIYPITKTKFIIGISGKVRQIPNGNEHVYDLVQYKHILDNALAADLTPFNTINNIGSFIG